MRTPLEDGGRGSGRVWMSLQSRPGFVVRGESEEEHSYGDTLSLCEARSGC